MAFLGFGKKENKEQKTDVNQSETSIPKKTEVTKKAVEPKTKKAPVSSGTSSVDYSSILINPRITEKAAIIAEEGNIYTFNVHPDANKKEVAKAIETIYKVKPVKVNIGQIKRKKVISRGKVGMKAGGKKAMVYLKEGDKIEFV